MKIPHKLEEILKRNQTLYSIVLDVMSSFQPVFDDNKLYFFDEYTDHGIKHIESVLAASEIVISNESIDVLTSKDIAILIFSIILHDIGMHIEFATFKSLIDGGYDHVRVSTIDKKTWLELWLDYLTEVKRFSSTQKRNIFGNEFQVFTEPDFSNKDKLTGYDKKLIGEFIRRYHTRIAHEIALNGLIGANNQKIEFGNTKLSILYKQLAGIVARSHGMNLRDTFEYLEKIASHGWRNPDDINVIFLMIILRIADYIQIDQSRVNPFLLKLKTFNSPVSFKENDAHLAITSLSFNQPDSERIFVSCNPINSEMFVKLRNLFLDIQKEFDISWAVLGEVYGFFQVKPQIKFRRITSNLEDNLYLETLSYVPKKISFEVNSELSKLLVAPLYGNKPTYGVRELLQNSIDACIERQHLESSSSAYIPKVTISIDKIDDKSSLFKIVDNGKGMSLEEIIHYFLNVGSSFRKSLAWKKQFINEEGHSLINRNGKFGIGVLAAFLLGDEILVKTKHLSEKVTYLFKTDIDSEFIDITKLDEDQMENNVGTTISIVISNNKMQELIKAEGKDMPWTEWYVNKYPAIEYILDGKPVTQEFEIDRSGVNCFETKDFKMIEWKYFDDSYRIPHIPFVVCNGIIITKELNYPKDYFLYPNENGNYVIYQKPSFMVEDTEGMFPLKLDRNDIDTIELPFETELKREIAKDFIAQILTLKVDISSKIKRIPIKVHDCELLYLENGFVLNFDYFIDNLSNKSFSFIRIITDGYYISNGFINNKKWVICPDFNEKINLSYQERNVAPLGGGRILLKSSRYNELFLSKTKRLPAYVKKNHFIEFENDKFVVYNFMNYKHEPTIFGGIEKINEEVLKNVESIQEIAPTFFKTKGGELLNEFLNIYIGDQVIIPYDFETRKKKYSKAFSELSHFMRNYID